MQRRFFTRGSVAQWVMHRLTEPGIAGPSPAGIIFTLAGIAPPPSMSKSLNVHAHDNLQARKHAPHEDTLVERGLETRTVRLFAVRSHQLSYATNELAPALLYYCVAMLVGFACAVCR